jgi:hypothetical protein
VSWNKYSNLEKHPLPQSFPARGKEVKKEKKRLVIVIL